MFNNTMFTATHIYRQLTNTLSDRWVDTAGKTVSMLYNNHMWLSERKPALSILVIQWFVKSVRNGAITSSLERW